MKLKFEILQENDSDLVIKHKDEFYNEEFDYSAYYAPVKNESIIINVIEYHSVHEDKIVYINANDTDKVADIMTNAPDGHYTIHHLIIPDYHWYNKYIAAKNGEEYNYENFEDQIETKDSPFDVSKDIDLIEIDENTNIIYYNGENVVDLEGNVIENLDSLVNLNVVSTVHQLSSDTFLIGNLYKCLINISLQQLDACIDRCFTEKDDHLSYIRNIVWMGINAIKYLVDQEHLSKAQQILERLNACPGLCNNPKPKLNSNSCGCNRIVKNEIRPRF